MDSMNVWRGWAALTAATLLFASCPGPDDAAAALGEVPDTISKGFRQVSVSPEGRVEITAERVEFFEDTDYTLFYSSKMKELDPKGALRLEGSADHLSVHGNRDGTAKGNIQVRDVKQKASLNAEILHWNNAERLLTGEDRVYVTSGDGLQLSGLGFKADMARESFSFSQDVQGTLEMQD